MRFLNSLDLRQKLAAVLASVLLVGLAAAAISCGGGSNVMTTGMGTVVVTLSDPPSCAAPTAGAAAVPAGGTAAPAGTFSSVFVTIRSIQAHISAAADANSDGWQELAPQLVSAPVQADLLHLPANGQCLLEQLGSTSLPAGDYQQIRLILVANAVPSGPVPSTNACSSLGNIFNCVVDTTGTHTLDLSSEANTGLKIPPGQVMGGPIHVAAGQSVDLNIDFNTCASIIKEGNGNFRLKPTLTAGVVSANTTGISGQIVDNVTSQPIAGAVVTLQFADMSGTDRIAMQELTDSNGHFGFCPLTLPVGAVPDVVVDAITSSGTAYDVTVVFNVTAGTNLGAVPLVAETPATAGASTGPGTIQGAITAINGTTGASIDATVSALQTVTVSSTSHTFTVPLFPTSNSSIQVNSGTSCATGSPAGAFCGSYTLVVPASNPNVGTISAGKVTFTAPASGDVLYTVEADATNPTSNAAICSPASQTTSKDSTNMPLKVTPGATTNAARIDFSGCS
ncbi:MAG: hypothetical protein AUH86_08270 [Acidobacteria bacterium 13_1_40CM_4_58_4]|nr:MAG: hypothetical protein AUH86_08270 [Acidobacteria bacterium 13_1_40CM_4_58_4]